MTHKTTHPRPPIMLRRQPTEAPYQHYAFPPGWRLRPWGGGARLTRDDAARGLGGGIRNDK
jgi:hypothetical protein